MKDRMFLIWIHQRLVHVHCTSPNLDYMHKLRCIIATIPPEQESIYDSRSQEVLNEIEDLERIARS